LRGGGGEGWGMMYVNPSGSESGSAIRPLTFGKALNGKLMSWRAAWWVEKARPHFLI
jgi:hypothetical protein